ncbi:MAG TPA: hypothetical protein VGG35_21555 [Streptosporangiaceae bacterium]
MTSTSEQRDDDVIVVTDENIVSPDEARTDETGLAEARHRAGYDMAGTDAADTDELAGDDPGAGELTHDDTRDRSRSAFAMPGGTPASDETVADETVTGEPVTDETGEPVTDETGEPVTDETGEPVAGETGETVPDDTTAGEMAASESLAEEPVTDEPLAADELVIADETVITDETPAAAAPAATTPAASEPAAGPAGPAAAATGPAAGAGVAGDDPWPGIQARFVDDPRSAVEQAAEVTTGALTALMASARNREQSLRDGWQANATGTEELRTSLRDYRELAQRLSGLASQL